MTPPAVLDEALAELCDVVAAAETVIPVGARTQWEVGGAPGAGLEVSAPAGVVRYEPADLTITVGGGTTVAELDEVLGAEGQECALDPWDRTASVGGVLACGLSGLRRLRHGPLRDRVLEVRVVTAAGRLVKGGGPTVKNVSGYDVPRLMVGSLGTLGVIGQATLRCTPRAPLARWAASHDDPGALRRRLFRPSCVAWDGVRASCLLEGHPDDVDAEMKAAGLEPGVAPVRPAGTYRGRIAVRSARLAELGTRLAAVSGLRWLAEIGVGTVHVAADERSLLESARDVAHELGGWMLREAGADLAPFGVELANRAVMARIKDALDPTGKFNPGRLL